MFDFLKNIYDLLVFDHTFLGMFICGLLLGFSFGIFQVISSLNVKLPNFLHGIIVILCILLGIAGFLLLFPMALNLLFEGFFRGLLLTLLGIIVSIAVFYFPIRTAKKKRLKKNPVLQKLVDIVKATSPAYVILCLDGIVTLNPTKSLNFVSDSDIECTSQQQFNNYSPLCQCSSYQKFCSKDNHATENVISFHKEGYPRMSPEDATLFMEVFGQQVNGYKHTQYSRLAQYTQPASYTTTNSPYYTINGNLAGGPNTSSTSEKHYSVLLDVYYVATRNDFMPKPNAALHSAPPPPKNKW